MVRLWGVGGGVLVVLLMSRRRVIIVSVSVGVSGVIYLDVLVTILNIIHLLCIFDNIPNT